MVRLLLFILLLPLFLRSQPDTLHVKADSLLTYAKSFRGTKYCYAQCTPKKGFDCSGFVYYVFGHFNIKVPRASMDYEKAGKKIPIDSCRTGDVIVFTGTNIKNRHPGHVGIILANDSSGVSFIHSSSGHNRIGVIITNYTASPYYQKRFIKVVRLSCVN